MKTILVYTHMGLGDHFVCNGLVRELTERENAEIAINAGFFQIGGNEDGRPTGTLIINGKIQLTN